MTMRKQLMLLTALLLISCPIFAQDESTEQSSSGIWLTVESKANC